MPVCTQSEERCAAAEDEVVQLRSSLQVAQHAASSAVGQYEKLRANLEMVAVRRQQMERGQVRRDGGQGMVE